MKKKTIVLVEGGEVEGELVDFKPIAEPWSKYELPDGTIVRLRLVASDIVRSSERDGTGTPIFAVKSTNVLAVDPPDEPEEAHRMQFNRTRGGGVFSTRDPGSGQVPPDGGWNRTGPMGAVKDVSSAQVPPDGGGSRAGPMDAAKVGDWPQGTVGGHLDPLLLAIELGRVAHVAEVRTKASGGVTHMWTIVEDGAYDDDETLNAVFQRELEIYDEYGGALLASVEFNVLSESSARGLELGSRLYPPVR